MLRWIALALCVAFIHGASVSSMKETILKRIRRQSSSACDVADMVFVLDSSGSIGSNNWVKVLEFVKSFITDVNIGPQNVQVGIVTYGNRASLQFNLNTYTNASQMLEAIDRIPWKDQATNTSGGVRFMHQTMFTTAVGDRDNAPNIGIVITDGESNRDRNLTIPESNVARESRVTMFALGITAEVNEAELQGIANTPAATFVFRADGFDALDRVKASLVSAACEVAVDCANEGDLVFMLDSSGSVGKANFDRVKAFVRSFVDGVNIATDKFQIGVMTFSTTPNIRFHINKFTDKLEMLKEIDALPYEAGTTNTADALQQARTSMFTAGNGDRGNRGNVVILITDGGSNDFAQTVLRAKEARIAGITLLVVAVGNWVNRMEINEIASDPDNLNVYSVANLANIDTISTTLRSTVCNNANECNSSPCLNGGTCVNNINSYSCLCARNFAGINCGQTCRQDQVDISFAIDTSSSIGERNFYTMMGVTKNIIRALNLNTASTGRLGLETYSNIQTPGFQMNAYQTKEQILNAISYRYPGGTTNTAAALSYMRQTMFTSANGDRTNARNIGIVMTDGMSNDRAATFREAVLSRGTGNTLLAVGIGLGGKYGQLELQGIASDPNDKNVFNAANFMDLFNKTGAISTALVDAVCNNVDECASTPCQGGAQCRDDIGAYECQCGSGRTGLNCERQCDGQMDVVFMLDCSGSIRENRFILLKNWLISIVNNMEVRPGRTRVGLVQFSDNAVDRFFLNTYENKQDVIHGIRMLEYTRGRTNIADAISKMASQFSAIRGDRANVPNIGVLVSDGFATVNRERSLPEAIAARIAGIHIMVAAPEGNVNNLEYQGIASDPDSQNIFTVGSYNNLNTIVTPVVNAMCDDANECNSNPCQNGANCVNGLKQYLCICGDRFTGINCERTCTTRRDIVFILDASGSVETSYAIQQQLTKQIVQGLNFNGGRTRVGVVSFADSATMQFPLSRYSNKLATLNAIAFLLSGGRTHTASALTLTRTTMFTAANGDRSGDANYVIVMSDGRSNINPQNTQTEAQRLRDNGATVLTVGIGADFNRGEMNGIATDPDSENTFSISQASQIASAASSILDRLCT